MKIKNVEELVGITRKNIRFYEEQGLLLPERADNGYREYNQKDIEQLMKIKLFRKLGIPIEDIKKLLEGNISMYECLDKNLDRLDKEKDNLEKMKDITSQLMQKHLNIHNVDTEEFLDEVERLERGGISFMKLEQTDIRKQKRYGAIASTVFILAIVVLYIGLILFSIIQDAAPVELLIMISIIGGIVAICAIVALVGRLKEIKGGEEDEASKY